MADPLSGPWGAVPPAVDGGAARTLVRELRARRPRITVALDDDPTGSQAVHGVEIVTEPDADEYRAAIATGPGAFFVLTNSRSRSPADARALNAAAADALFDLAAMDGRPLQFVSRGDSTLRGHVIEEVDEVDRAHRRATGRGYDAVLFAPAYLDAGRVTVGGVHWARTADGFVPVGETEFARDATFGFRASDLREFVAERSHGTIAATDVGLITIDDIRGGGVAAVRAIIAAARGRRFLVVDALDDGDLDVVAAAALQAEDAGQALLYRTAPSFVRALLAQAPAAPLTTRDVWPDGPPAGHGLVVVGSHVGQTSRQLAELARRGHPHELEVDVGALLALDAAGEAALVARLAATIVEQLGANDVVLYASRTLVSSPDPDVSLSIARRVSDAISAIVRAALPGRPAWVVAKGGITSHDVAVHGLGIRRASVAGQFFPGLVSLFRPVVADARIVGRPYVVFAGNVGDDHALADVVARLRGESEGADRGRT